MERPPTRGDGLVFSFGLALLYFFSLFPFLFRYPQYTGPGFGELDSGLVQPIANSARREYSTWGTGVMLEVVAEKHIPGYWGSAGS